MLGQSDLPGARKAHVKSYFRSKFSGTLPDKRSIFSVVVSFERTLSTSKECVNSGGVGGALISLAIVFVVRLIRRNWRNFLRGRNRPSEEAFVLKTLS